MITDSERNYDISCTWASSVPNETVTFGVDNDPKEWDEDGGIIHVISSEKLVFLNNIENEPCMLHVKLKDPSTQITNVSIVSEGRILEIYGKYGEYIKTCKCEHISEENGIDFYAAQTDLLTTEEITIKFPGVKKGIWLCGVKLLVKNVPLSVTSFDYNLVDDKLKRSSIQITEKAEQFKKFLQEYAANKYPSTKGLDPQMLLKMMEGECMSHLKPVETAGRNISKYLSNIIPSLLKNGTNSFGNNVQHDIKKDSNCNAANSSNSDQTESVNSLKSYIDEHMEKLEERLQDNFKRQIQELEAKQNEKLDTILTLLKSSALS